MNATKTLITVFGAVLVLTIGALIALPIVKGKARGCGAHCQSMMKSDLRNLVTAEQMYFSQHGSYTASDSLLTSVWSTITTEQRVLLTPGGFTARVGNTRDKRWCSIFLGSETLPPANVPGEPRCSRPAPRQVYRAMYDGMFLGLLAAPFVLVITGIAGLILFVRKKRQARYVGHRHGQGRRLRSDVKPIE